MPQAVMAGRGEASAPTQQRGTTDPAAAEPPVGKNTVTPPSLRSMFPTDRKEPSDKVEQTPPKVVPAAEPKDPANSFSEKTSKELPERRDRFSQTFVNADKTETTVLSQGPLNFKTPDGSWAKIDADLAPADVKGGWEVISNEVYSWIAPKANNTPLVQMELGNGHNFGWSLAGAGDVAGQMTENKVLFPGVAPGADLELESQPTGIKETIVLGSKTAGRTYTFPLQLTDNLTPSLVGKEIVLTDENGVQRGKIPAGVMEDSSTTNGSPATSTAIEYELVTVDGKPAIKVVVDDAWLDDPARVYPVKVDPTFYWTESQKPSYAVSTGLNGGIDGGQSLQIGCRPGPGQTTCPSTGWNVFASYLSFPSLVPALQYHKIFTARLDLLNYESGSCAARWVDVHGVTQAWQNIPQAQLKFPGPPVTPAAFGGAGFAKGYIATGQTSSACKAGYQPIELQAAGRDWIQSLADGTRDNWGLAVRARNQNDSASWKKFAGVDTANPPRLVVTHSPYRASYTAMPQNPADYITQDKPGKFPIYVKNLGAYTWQPGVDFMTYRVFDEAGNQVHTEDAHKTQFPTIVSHLGGMTLPVSVQKLPGSADGVTYFIEFTMVHQDGSIPRTFTDWGIGPLVLKVVVKNVPPVVDPAGVWPLNGAQATTLRPQVWADAVDPDAPETSIQYRFEVCEVVGTDHRVDCFTSGDYGAAKTWVVPFGKLAWNKEYEWRPWIRDNDGVVKTIQPITMFTDVPQPVITSHLASSEAQPGDKPFDPQGGNYTTAALDVVVPVAGPELNVARTYNSLDPRRDGLFGAGWSSRYDMRVKVDGIFSVLVTYPDGRQVRFARNTDGSYAAPRGSKAILTGAVAGPWTLQIAPGTKYEFAATSGRLSKISGAQGKPLALTYDSADVTAKLQSVASQDGAGRKLTFSWTQDGKHVASVSTQPVGGTPLTWTYEYTGDALTKSCNSEQKCTTYGFEQGSHYRSAVLDSKPDVYYRLSDAVGIASNEVDIAPRTDFGSHHETSLGQESALAGVGDADKSTGFGGATAKSSVGLRNGLLNRSRDASVEMWFKTGAAGSQPLIGYQNKALGTTPTAGMPLLYVGSDGKLRGQFWQGAAAPITSPALVNDNQWHHVALNASDGSQTVYLDGAFVGRLDTGAIDNDPFPIGQIGAAATARASDWPGWGTETTRYFDGLIDEVSLYSHPISAKEIQSHYELGKTAADQLTSITTPAGRTLAQLRYNPADDRITEYVDANGGSWDLDIARISGGDTDLRRTVRVTDPASRSYVYEYDALAGRLLRVGRPLAARTRAEDHPSSPAPEVAVDWPRSGYGIRSFTYDKTGVMTKVTNEVGAEVSMTYDSRGNVASTKTCRTGATDCRTEFNVYHANSAWSPLDPRWDKLAIYRDGRSSSATDDTYRRSTSLNAAGDFVTERSPDGGEVNYTYTDGVATGPDGQPMPAGLLRTSTSKVTAATTAQTQYLYNQHGQVVQLTAPSGLVTKYTYDEIGRKLTETQVSDSHPDGVTSTYSYDKMSRVVSVTGPVTTDAVTGDKHQQKAEIEYDDDGNVAKSTAKDLQTGDEPRVTTFEYDDRGRVIRTVDATGKETQQGYDQFGNKTWAQDANGARFEYAYNDLNLLTEVRDFNMPGENPDDPEDTPEDGPTEGVDYTIQQATWYDPAGRKSVDVDAMKRVTNYAYNGDDTLKTATLVGFHNPDGTTRDFVLASNTYDNAGNRTRSVTDNGKTTIDYTYDLAGRVATTTADPQTLKRKTTDTHDLAGNVTKRETTGAWSNADLAGPTTVTDVVSYVFDTAGRPVETKVQNTDGSFLTTSSTYDQRGLKLTEVQPRGNVAGAVKADFTTKFEYDELGRQIRTVAPKVQAEENGGPAAAVQPSGVVGYGAFGQQTSVKDALGNISKTAFDQIGRPVEVTGSPYSPPGGQALTPKATVEYDAVGNVLAQIDERGNATRFTYDHLNRQIQVDAPGKTNDERALTKLTYTPTGEVESATDPLGAVTKYTYDDLDRPVTTTAVERKPVAGNFVTRLTYDDLSNVVKAQTPSGAIATNTYDTLGQLTQSADPNNVLAKLGYDYAGRQVRSSDGLGRSSVASYNMAGQLVSSKVLDAANNPLGTTQLGYDADGNLISSTPASGNRATTYTYDALGRLTQQIDPVTATQSITIGYGYDAAGNRTRYTDGRGNSTTYTINTLGLPEKVIEPSTTAHPAPADRTWTASYDAAGNSSLLLSPGGVQRTRTYDAVGRLLKEEGTGAEASTATRELAYDLAGRLVSSSSIDGANTYNYNDRGMLLRADGPSGTSTQGYDADGQLTQRIDAAGTADFTYLNGRPATVTDPVTRTTQALGYNTAGQLSTIDYGSGRLRTVGYDAYGRMNADTLKAGQSVVFSMTYGYDADNNITSKKTTGVAGAADNTYSYDQLGRLTSWTAGTKTTEYGWDAASNRTKAGTKLATYDERNRLINDGTSDYTYSPRGSLLTKKAGATTEAFTFDAFDRMIKSSDRDFTYDALDRPVAAGTARMRYAGFSDEVVTDGTQSFGRSASDGLLSVGYEATKRLVLADRHGDIIGGFDPTDTTLAAGLPDSRTYDPFGNSTAANGLKYRIGYQGDWTDPRSGDVNQGARWYNTESGTFNSRDTISHAAGSASSLPNLYAYAGGNPLTFNDPSGNYRKDPDNPGSTRKHCYWKNMDELVLICEVIDNPTPPPPPPGGCKKDCDHDPGPGCKQKDCDLEPTCKTNQKLCPPPVDQCKRDCGDRPPPPKCDAECQRKKKEREDRERTEKALKDQETRAQTNPVNPPGDPSCSAANPSLCPSKPTRPADQNGGYVDRTTQTGDSADRTYQNAVTTLGSTIGSITQTGSVMTNGLMLPWSNIPCEAGGCGGGMGPGGLGGLRGVPVGPVVGLAAMGIELGELAKNLTILNLFDLGGGGGTAQPPNDDDPAYGGGRDIDEWNAARGVGDGPDHVVLGKSQGLPERAAQIGGRHLMNYPSGEWQTEVVKAINNPNTKISVALDDVNGSSAYSKVMNSVQKYAAGANNRTPFDWEMTQLKESGRLSDVDFYLNGAKVANPFK
jgi:RHS repeat-associated protein